MPPLPHRIEFIASLMRREDTPLRGLEQWKPFRIDALGLVTLLGAEEVNKSVGTLQRRRFTEWLPLLAAFVIAGDRFTDEEPGYSLYNISDGIHTTELKGWFTRWLSAQQTRNSTTIFRWKLEPKPRYNYGTEGLAPAIAFIAVVPLLVCTCLIGDWFGVGNSLAIVLSILVRKYLLWQRRTALNAVAVPSDTDQLPMHNPPAEKSVDTFTKQMHRPNSQPLQEDEVKMFVTRADGRLVTIYAPRSILHSFVKDAPLPDSHLYHLARWTGWAAFGAHIIVLGMSSLFAQIYTVVLLVLATWAMCHNFALDTGREYSQRQAMDGTMTETIKIPFTTRLFVEQENPSPVSSKSELTDKRMHAYVRVQPTEKQEAMLKHWSMLPFEGVPWYDTYEQTKREYDQYRANYTKSLSPQPSPGSTDAGASPSPGLPGTSGSTQP